MNIDVNSALQTISFSSTVQTLLFVASISLIPFFLITMTSFLRIIIVLSFVRSAIGTQQVPPSSVITSLALFMTIFIMMPVYQDIQQNALKPHSEGRISQEVMWQRLQVPIRGFMLNQVREKELELFVEFSGLKSSKIMRRQDFLPITNRVNVNVDNVWNELVNRGYIQNNMVTEKIIDDNENLNVDFRIIPKSIEKAIVDKLFEGLEVNIDEVPMHVIIPAFAVSELKTAFQMGFLLFIPFLVIDLIVANILLSLGMFMLSPVMVSLPFKILLFVLADGWYIVTRGLMISFGTFM